MDAGRKGCRQAEEGILLGSIDLQNISKSRRVEAGQAGWSLDCPGNKNSGLGGVWQSHQERLLASKRFWHTVWRLRRGKQCCANTVYCAGGDLLTTTGEIVGRWKKYFKELFVVTPRTEQVEAGDYEEDSAITIAKVTKVVIKHLSGRASGTDDICPEYFKSLDLIRMSCLKCLCNIAWQSGTVPLEWQPGMVVPLFKDIGVSHSSASLEKAMPEYWRGEFGH